jgi:hypothetical protein
LNSKYLLVLCETSVDPGFGAGLSFYVRVCTSDSSLCYWSPPSIDTMAYPPPSFTPGTIRLRDSLTAATGLVLSQTYATSIAFNGSFNAGTASYFSYI